MGVAKKEAPFCMSSEHLCVDDAVYFLHVGDVKGILFRESCTSCPSLSSFRQDVQDRQDKMRQTDLDFSVSLRVHLEFARSRFKDRHRA